VNIPPMTANCFGDGQTTLEKMSFDENQKGKKCLIKPYAVYEVAFGSWKSENRIYDYLTYSELGQ